VQPIRYPRIRPFKNLFAHSFTRPGTDIKIDETMERRICAAVLKQLDDPGNDVKSMAVKCLENLIKKVQQAQVGEICDKLTVLIVDGRDELRDIYSIGIHLLMQLLIHDSLLAIRSLRS